MNLFLVSHSIQNLVEAHWKYFTIETASPSECDRAAQLHYEFLLHRCKPKHYLPVLSVFRRVFNALHIYSIEKMSIELVPRPTAGATAARELTSHIYPKPNLPQPGGHNR